MVDVHQANANNGVDSEQRDQAQGPAGKQSPPADLQQMQHAFGSMTMQQQQQQQRFQQQPSSTPNRVFPQHTGGSPATHSSAQSFQPDAQSFTRQMPLPHGMQQPMYMQPPIAGFPQQQQQQPLVPGQQPQLSFQTPHAHQQHQFQSPHQQQIQHQPYNPHEAPAVPQYDSYGQLLTNIDHIGYSHVFDTGTERDSTLETKLFSSGNTAGIDFDKYDDIPVTATGNDVVEPVATFEELNFPEVLSVNIQLANYHKPTPIQRYALPAAWQGRDLMCCSQTGSGKTAAFLFPLIASLTVRGRVQPLQPPRRVAYPVGLCLAPTRELATQIFDEAVKFTYRTGYAPCVIYGGADARFQSQELGYGCDILVATPGRLLDFVQRGRISLSQVGYLVFDEADRMLDMGFEPQIRQIVHQSDMNHYSRQTLLFSATFPKDIQQLASEFLTDYIFIAVGKVGAAAELVQQTVLYVPEEIKYEKLCNEVLPQCSGLTLVFVERKKSATQLERWLRRQRVTATSIHGDRSQIERENALELFKTGRCKVLVATDVAARGLDIPHVTDVINFDLPSNIDDYVHRIGRTGRAGNTGKATAFFNEKNINIAREMCDMLTDNKQPVPEWLTRMAGATGGAGGRGRGRGGRGGAFGGTDYRNRDQFGQRGGYQQHRGGRGGMIGGVGGMAGYPPLTQQPNLGFQPRQPIYQQQQQQFQYRGGHAPQSFQPMQQASSIHHHQHPHQQQQQPQHQQQPQFQPQQQRVLSSNAAPES